MTGHPAWGNHAARRKVAGKAQLAVSALGMFIVLAALVQGRFLWASAVFLLTLGTLEFMFRRAVAVFYASAGAHGRHIRRIAHAAPADCNASQQGGGRVEAKVRG